MDYQNRKEAFDSSIKDKMTNQKNSNKEYTREELEQIRKCVLELQGNKRFKSASDIRLLKRFEVDDTSMLFKRGTNLIFVGIEEILDVIHNTHLELGHAGRDITRRKLAEKYANITESQILLYLEGCETCALKKKRVKKGLVVKPIVSNNMNSRGQCDLIDMQSEPDSDYKFMLTYQHHLTKFCFLKPLKRKTGEEVAAALLDIFCVIGAPHILQTDNGKEFCNAVLNSLVESYDHCKIVHGKPRYSQS